MKWFVIVLVAVLPLRSTLVAAAVCPHDIVGAPPATTASPVSDAADEASLSHPGIECSGLCADAGPASALPPVVALHAPAAVPADVPARGFTFISSAPERPPRAA